MEVKKEAEKVLKELSDALGEIKLKETYYVVEEINVTRKDGDPVLDEKFRKISKKNAVHIDDEGYFVTEIGRWVE
jgi:predicted Asp-tRNA(Asn)/Glu-tRNA(Gln) amidotransferase subunit C